MEITTMAAGTRGLAMAWPLAMPGVAVRESARLRARTIGQPVFGGHQSVYPVRLTNSVAPIGTDVPFAGRTRASAPEP